MVATSSNMHREGVMSKGTLASKRPVSAQRRNRRVWHYNLIFIYLCYFFHFSPFLSRPSRIFRLYSSVYSSSFLRLDDVSSLARRASMSYLHRYKRQRHHCTTGIKVYIVAPTRPDEPNARLQKQETQYDPRIQSLKCKIKRAVILYISVGTAIPRVRSRDVMIGDGGGAAA